jgi:hypothetical protein
MGISSLKEVEKLSDSRKVILICTFLILRLRTMYCDGTTGGAESIESGYSLEGLYGTEISIPNTG